MTEWRRTLRSWPKETSRVMDVASAPAWTRDPERLRETQREDTLGALFAILVGFGLPMAATFALAAWFAPSGKGFVAAAIFLPGMALSMTGLFASAKIARERLGTRQRRRMLNILEARGEVTLGGEFVGVAYEDRLWCHPTMGDDADRGVLTLGLDRLTFVGRNSRFEIPAHAVLGTEIRRFDQAITGSLPRLYVTYADETGKETVSVALPYRGSLRRRVREIADLRARLDAWRADPLPSANARTLFTFPEGEAIPPVQSKYQRIGFPAKIIAGVLIATIGIVVQAILTITLTLVGFGRAGGFLGGLIGLYWVLWIFLAAKVETMLPECWRYREPETTRQPSELGEAPSESEPDHLTSPQPKRLDLGGF